MSYGLRVWDASGNLTLDVTNRITRVYSANSVYFATYDLQKTISHAGVSTDGTWFAAATTGGFSAVLTNGQVTVYRLHTEFIPITVSYVIFRA